MSKKGEDLKKVNKHFDSIIESLGEYVKSTKTLMPFTSIILKSAQESAKLYKELFNRDLKELMEAKK